jgi:[ribosomal protein S5]-alanine N-acetyltransferase
VRLSPIAGRWRPSGEPAAHTFGETGLVHWSPPDPPLRAGSVVLRRFRADDAADVVAACTDPDIVRFTFMRKGLTEAAAVKWIEQGNEWWPHGHPRFAIADATDDRVLGQVGMAVNEHHRSAEAYYWVSPSARRCRVAWRSVGLLADWAFDAGVERLFLLIHPENEPSNRLAERLGFTREGVLRSYEPFKGSRPDLVSWSLLPQDPRPTERLTGCS